MFPAKNDQHKIGVWIRHDRKYYLKSSFATDTLTALLRSGARHLIAQAAETELAVLLDEHNDLHLPDGRKALVRNGYLPERTVQTGIGDVLGAVTA